VKGAYSTLVTAPATAVVTLSEMKAVLRVDSDDDDTEIGDFIQDATEKFDAEFGELGRALITQTWRLTMPHFPLDGKIELPISPVQSVSSIQYFDVNGVQQTLSTDAYRFIDEPDEPFIERVDGATWPGTFTRSDCVTVTYVAGYGNAATDVPESIRQPLRLLVAHAYENREAVSEATLTENPMGVRYAVLRHRTPKAHF